MLGFMIQPAWRRHVSFESRLALPCCWMKVKFRRQIQPHHLGDGSRGVSEPSFHIQVLAIKLALLMRFFAWLVPQRGNDVMYVKPIVIP